MPEPPSKTLTPEGLVTGHNPSRAENANQIRGALAPEGSSERSSPQFGDFSASSLASPPTPPDQQARLRALDPTRSFLVQAPAGSGKTYLLTQRFLRLLAQAQRPDEIVAITFTVPAAAEMRNRVLQSLEAAAKTPAANPNPESLEALAAAALRRAQQMNWQLLEFPSQLRITTIDAFCRSIALQSPLNWGPLSSLGGTLNPAPSSEAYRAAARRTLAILQDEANSAARQSVESLLLWRDNNWQDIEFLIVQMLENRNRWMQDFVFARAAGPESDPENAIWPALRRRLEAPFRRAARRKLETLHQLLDRLPESRDYALQLARQACSQGGKQTPASLAERAELPTTLLEPGHEEESLHLEDAASAYRDLANFLQTAAGGWRKKGGLNVHHGFPPTPQGKAAKDQFCEFLESLAQEPGLESALAAFQKSLPIRYQEQEWQLIRHCFAVLRTAAAHLQLVFAETGSVDFTEIAQIALRVLAPEDGFPSDFALRQADSIRHLLVDEFQDTSRKQHQLLARLIAAWPDREGRTCFCVGDPMQSIYGFRDAEVELFERLKTHGLEPDPGLYHHQFSDPFPFEFLQLQANFRTVPSLIADLNQVFPPIFNPDSDLPPGLDPNSSTVQFSPAIAARASGSAAKTELHLAFTQAGKLDPGLPESTTPEGTSAAQLEALVTLVQQKLAAAQSRGEKQYRIAILARTRKPLIPIAEALREREIPFRAIELVKLNERPEVLDALTLARALLNPADRTAWLGILRAPWCGLPLADLHLITSADDPAIASQSIPLLLETRLPQLENQLAPEAFAAATRVAQTMRQAIANRAAANTTLGTWLESVWISLGGADTVNPAQAENLRALWSALDKLPQRELDLLGPALTSALDQLYALPDPAASSELGIQLMTIHKSKGLEFEIVLVPDLEALNRHTEHTLMSWLERGLPPSDDPTQDGQISEFLIAPIKTKGGEASPAKEWVDSVKKQRDLLELRRLFYVAATRAREELHLFARPRFTLKNGEATLAAPNGLLATAWPAFGGQIERQFTAWSTETQAPSEPLAMAASADNLLLMPAKQTKPPTPARIRRLPANYRPPQQPHSETASGATSDHQPYTRAEGGPESRLLGTAIHALLERFTHLRLTLPSAQAIQALPAELPAIAAELRAAGLARTAAMQLASDALAAAQQAATDPIGAWIFTPHPGAETESQWTAWSSSGDRGPTNLRPDRVLFAAPPPPLPQSEPCWWIVDYKSAQIPSTQIATEAEKRDFLSAHRARYAPQLAAYAGSLRELRGEPALPIRAAIFYPRLLLFDHWEC